MNKATLENGVREQVYELLFNTTKKELNPDARAIGPGEFMIPLVDAERNELYATVKITIPRGKREGGTYVPYDGEAAADEWDMILHDRAETKRAREEKSSRAKAEKERKKKAKEIVKKLNTEGFDALVHQDAAD